jgi:hypothetical protein
MMDAPGMCGKLATGSLGAGGRQGSQLFAYNSRLKRLFVLILIGNTAYPDYVRF